MKAFLQELKRRNVFRVAVIYIVVSWLLMQIGDVMFPALRLPEWSTTMLVAFLILGFPVALILAWAYEATPEGIKRASEVEPGEPINKVAVRKADFIIIAVLAAAIIFLVGKNRFEGDSSPLDSAPAPDQPRTTLPLVVMMDSHHPTRVYDDDTLASGGTNADVVSDILLDLPIRRQKEAVSPEWHRDEDILGFQPDLIIIHYSSFRHGFSDGPRERLRLFIEFLADTETRFLIYGRWKEVTLQEAVETLLAELDQEHPGLLERIHVYGLLDHGKPKWRDPANAASLKLRVKRILAID